MSNTHKTIVLSVGGSLVAPKAGIDTKFLRAFRELVRRGVRRGWRFVIVVGGGATARAYQEAARQTGGLTREDLDWLGIHSTRLNGHLLRTVLRELADPEMYNDPRRVPTARRHKVVIAAGWKPGWSTDYVATRIARRLKASVVVNLSNIDYLYDKDPRKYKTAKIIRTISWRDFRRMVGDKWDPGMNVPFDPVASKLAQASGLQVVIMNGTNMRNIENLLAAKPFIGTVVG